jgi:hypothetical protein
MKVITQSSILIKPGMHRYNVVKLANTQLHDNSFMGLQAEDRDTAKLTGALLQPLVANAPKMYWNTQSNFLQGRAIVQADSRRLPPRWLGFKHGSGHVGFVVD